jgi:autotransporter adhesin
MKSFITLFLAFSLFSTQAMATTNAGLKDAFNELDYALSVEWDQQDEAFHRAQTDLFIDRIVELQAAGLTNAEMMNFTISQVKNNRVAADLTTLFDLVNANKLSENQVLEMIQTMRKDSQTQGANWSGTATIVTLSIFVVAAVVTYSALKTRHETAKNSIGNVR